LLPNQDFLTLGVNRRKVIMKTPGVLIFLQIALLSVAIAQPNTLESSRVEMLIRCDDIGMCHTVNTAFKEVLDTGMPVSASVMFACPWYREAVELLTTHTNACVGIHLMLNAEWENYRWGPVAGRSAVPSLVDSEGYFYPSRSSLFAHNPKLDEIEHELRAQIERAMRSGLHIDYLDYHMNAVLQTLEIRGIVEKLAREYKLGLSLYFGDEDIEAWYAVPIEAKKDTVLQRLKTLEPGAPKVFVFHVGLDTPEMSALIDMNSFGLKHMSRHRQAELRALTSPEFRTIIERRKIHLKTYADLMKEIGLEGMKRPAQP
jgi:chitin disaccharide deacetylase